MNQRKEKMDKNKVAWVELHLTKLICIILGIILGIIIVVMGVNWIEITLETANDLFFK